ncbi:hypothetical protein Pelo_3390 [Pelomyxa schiedti]|nr:hypothetical protein Pelo_3390 [Pelomyxa schiedti]
MILSTLTRRSGCRRPVHVAAQSDFNGPGQNYCMYLLCFLPGNLPDGNLIQPTQERHTPRSLCVWLCSPFCRFSPSDFNNNITSPLVGASSQPGATTISHTTRDTPRIPSTSRYFSTLRCCCGVVVGVQQLLSDDAIDREAKVMTVQLLGIR